MTTKGRTTRTMLEALSYLSRGRDTVIVAHPAEEAFRIADEVYRWAKDLGIPCVMSENNRGDERHSDEPLLMVRPFGWTPTEYADWRPEPKIVVDHSAVHEKCVHAAPPAFRTVLT